MFVALLMVNFVWHLCLPGNKHDPHGAVMADTLITVGLLLNLYVTKRTLSQRAPGDVRWKLGAPLYWAALISGVGVLLIRFWSIAR
ncbi:hypothetical protein CK220_03070 [Mesorhizobium sp. WSM3860]|nr:hypothetical protein CK220_03070 [Mesorhizobium sp. WSM3860]